MTTPTAAVHTPGPWKYWTSINVTFSDTHDGDHHYNPVTHHGRTVALVPVQAHGDLMLAAAAPDLLAALEAMVELHISETVWPTPQQRTVWPQARAAIAKASGQ